MSRPSHTQPREPINPDTGNRTASIGLMEAYEFRTFASTTAHAIMTASGEQLQAEALRARALRDANVVWQAAQDEARVCRGVGKPKGVTARNDPAREKSSKRKPAIPLGPSKP